LKLSAWTRGPFSATFKGAPDPTICCASGKAWIVASIQVSQMFHNRGELRGVEETYS
jgi:hypothetical protein